MAIITPEPLTARPVVPEVIANATRDYTPLERALPLSEHEWPEGTRPLLSVYCLTFNQEKYIEEAIQGFLSQETSFPVQIVIHDDASTDKTTNTLRKYEALYPKLFLLILQPLNLYSRGIFRKVEHLLYGKYIAFCEGDDYWTHPRKLEIQCKRLERNPTAVLSYHPVLSIYTDGSLCKHQSTRKPELDNHLEDFARHGNYIPTASVVLRNRCLPLPEVLEKSPAADFCRWIDALRYGSLDFIANPMAVYRVGSGRWSTLSKEDMNLNHVTIYLVLYEHFIQIGNNEIAEIFRSRIVARVQSLKHRVKSETIQKWQGIGDNASVCIYKTLLPADRRRTVCQFFVFRLIRYLIRPLLNKNRALR